MSIEKGLFYVFISFGQIIKRLWSIFNSDLPSRQPRNLTEVLAVKFECDLPNRQLRIGQEENNLPAEQAVLTKPIEVALGGFGFGKSFLPHYRLVASLIHILFIGFCPSKCYPFF